MSDTAHVSRDKLGDEMALASALLRWCQSYENRKLFLSWIPNLPARKSVWDWVVHLKCTSEPPQPMVPTPVNIRVGIYWLIEQPGVRDSVRLMMVGEALDK